MDTEDVYYKLSSLLETSDSETAHKYDFQKNEIFDTTIDESAFATQFHDVENEESTEQVSESPVNKEDQRSDTNQEVEIADDFNILKQEIDEFQQKINAQLMNKFAAAHKHLYSKYCHTLKTEKQMAQSQFSKLQDQIATLRHEISRYSLLCNHQETVIHNFSELLSYRSKKERDMWTSPHSAAHCFRAWRIAAIARKDKQKKIILAECNHLKAKKREAFKAWSLHCRKTKIQSIHLQWESKMEHCKKELVGEMMDQLQQAKQREEDALYALQQAQNQKTLMEQHLRTIFLRGMSAMNLEAMSLFGPMNYSEPPNVAQRLQRSKHNSVNDIHSEQESHYETKAQSTQSTPIRHEQEHLHPQMVDKSPGPFPEKMLHSHSQADKNPLVTLSPWSSSKSGLNSPAQNLQKKQPSSTTRAKAKASQTQVLQKRIGLK